MVHIRQSRPDSGLDFRVKVLKTFFELFLPRSAGKGACEREAWNQAGAKGQGGGGQARRRETCEAFCEEGQGEEGGGERGGQLP